MKNENSKADYNSDVTEEDLSALGEKTKNTRTDGGDDLQLINRNNDVDFAGKDLDVPGRSMPKNQINLKDEENQLYSQGGSENENLEQDTDTIR
ncbi:hypothetical protein SAMN04488007_2308 [Maribacter aquivivus]|uniref:Uncharacterized protein n=1 Tax=Maribacter aquivivus TaxID=228958 RepID=A0A1M6QEY5_9FLAO|nr:hypothetical protein [Maribacter aquivivus]SHK18874.1 hypothetical protein SAMN04488007_2308 [Maribacter aquivivus]